MIFNRTIMTNRMIRKRDIVLVANLKHKRMNTYLYKLCFYLEISYIAECLCGGCETSPRTSSLCSYIVLVLKDHGNLCCLRLK